MQITDEQFDQFLADNKMNYTVAMKPQFIKVPAMDDEGNLVLGTTKEVAIGHCPVRTDTMQPLSNGGLSKNFIPIQNREAFSVLPALSNVTDMKLVKGDIWGGGAGTYAQISLGGMQIGNGANDDYVGKYLSVVNSHDGSQAMRVLITPYRFFCKNQIAPAVSKAEEGVTMISIRHNANAAEQLDQMIESVKIADEVFLNSEAVYNQLAGQKINSDFVSEVVAQMFPAPAGPEVTTRMKNGWEKKVRATLNRFNAADGLRDEQAFNNVQDDPNVFNAWNLYNAVQGTFQHDSKNTAAKDKSILMGNIAKKSATALDVVTQVASPDHIPMSVQNEIDALVGEVMA
jgi:hypothetical protein